MTTGDHQVSEDDDFYRWNRLENLESVGRRFLVKWSRAVELQAERVLDPSRPFDDREVDAWQFCTAARQVSRAAEMLARLDGAPDGLRAAVTRFVGASPHLKTARDVIDHFDDYAHGIGNLAHPNVRRVNRNRSEAAVRRFEPRFSTDGGSAYIEIDGSTIDVALAAEAVNTLISDVLTEAGLKLRSETGELPELDETDPLFHVMVLSFISRHLVSPEDYDLFIQASVENPSTWPDHQTVQVDLGRHLPFSRTRNLDGGLVFGWLGPEAYEGRMVTGEDVAILDSWAVVLVPQQDGTWLIRHYNRNPYDDHDVRP